MLHPTTPTYSTCGCTGNSPSKFSDLCEALSPAESFNTPARRDQNFIQPGNSTAEACLTTFNFTCVQEYNNGYSWAVDNCVSSGSALFRCGCGGDDSNCTQSVGAVSEDNLANDMSATLWYNNQVSGHMTVT